MNTLDTPQGSVAKEVSPWPTGNKYGLYTGLILIVLGLVIHLAGLVDYTDQNASGNWIANIVSWGGMIAGISLAIKYHRDEELGGYVEFGRAFYVGFIVSLIVAILTLVWTYLFFSFIEPDIIEIMKEGAYEQMIEQQGMSEEQADQAMSYMKFFLMPAGLSTMAAISTLITGVIFSLIIAAIMKKSNQ
jgi:hypothetical protein